MKSICMLLVAFALFSTSSQSSMSFAKFTQGHNSDTNFLVTGSSNSNLNEFVKHNKIYILPLSESTIALKLSCGNCKKVSNGKEPICAVMYCTKSNLKIMDEFKTVVFTRPDAASFFWNQKPNEALPFSGPKGTLTVVRSA